MGKEGPSETCMARATEKICSATAVGMVPAAFHWTRDHHYDASQIADEYFRKVTWLKKLIISKSCEIGHCKKKPSSNVNVGNSLRQEILKLEKRLQDQVSVRCALEKALGYKTSSRDINNEATIPKDGNGPDLDRILLFPDPDLFLLLTSRSVPDPTDPKIRDPDSSDPRVYGSGPRIHF
ncbi:hypothetical protein OROMI_029865 [Orobanche minor]